MTTYRTAYKPFLQHPIISTDTRKIAPGSLFFALKGDKFDANTFAAQALEAGAAYAVIDNPVYHAGEKVYFSGRCVKRFTGFGTVSPQTINYSCNWAYWH